MNPIVRAACSLIFVSTTALAATIAAAPPTARDDAFDIIQGVRVADPYRWLEDPNDPKVQAWSDAQNVRTRDYLDALPSRASVKQQLTTLITATSPAYYNLQARGALVFALYSDPAKQQPMLVTLNAQADPASRKVLLDPNALDAKGLTAMDWFVPSVDGSKVAVSLSKNGSEDGTLPLPDVAGNSEIEPLASGDVLFNVRTYLRPVYFARWSPATLQTQETALKVTTPIDFSDATVTRIFATSKDGTKVPVNVIAKKTAKLDGRNPLLL